MWQCTRIYFLFSVFSLFFLDILEGHAFIAPVAAILVMLAVNVLMTSAFKN